MDDAIARAGYAAYEIVILTGRARGESAHLVVDVGTDAQVGAVDMSPALTPVGE